MEAQTREGLEALIRERAQRDPELRSQLARNPRAALETLTGLEIPAGIEITVVEEAPGEVVLTLPAPHASDELSEAEIASATGGASYYCLHPSPDPLDEE